MGALAAEGVLPSDAAATPRASGVLLLRVLLHEEHRVSRHTDIADGNQAALTRGALIQHLAGLGDAALRSVSPARGRFRVGAGGSPV